MKSATIDKLPYWGWLADNIGFDNYAFGGLPEENSKWDYHVYIQDDGVYLHLLASEEQFLYFLLRWS